MIIPLFRGESMSEGLNEGITLFLDIDGVLNIPQEGIPMVRIPLSGLWVHPIPHVHAFLQAIDKSEHIHPVWLSRWGKAAHGWNDCTKTSHWEVGYPIDAAKAREVCPDTNSTKQLAVEYYLHCHPDTNAVWMEDGFDDKEREWARKNRILLLDTLIDPLRSLLLSKDEQAIHGLIDTLMEIV
jgi:hypothetical protein